MIQTEIRESVSRRTWVNRTNRNRALINQESTTFVTSSLDWKHRIAIGCLILVIIGGSGCAGSANSSSGAAIESVASTSMTTESTTTTQPSTATTSTPLPPPTETSISRPRLFAGNDFQGLANYANARNWSDGLIPSFRPPHTVASIRASINYLANWDETRTSAPTVENCSSSGRMREWNYREMLQVLEKTRDRKTVIPVSLARIYFLCGEQMTREVAQSRVNSSEQPGSIWKWSSTDVESAITEFLQFRTLN
jgi:hypothetical protein